MIYKYKIGCYEYETTDRKVWEYWTEAESSWLKKHRHLLEAEAAPTSAFAPVTRKRPAHFGAPDSSGSVARVAQARLASEHDEEDVPLDSVKSDLKRKKALHAIMPGGDKEGILDDLLGDDDENACHDEDGNVVDCDDPAAIDKPERESGYGMSQGVTGPPTEAPDGLSGKELGQWASDNAVKLPPDDPLVNLRYYGSQPPAPGARCGNCVYFDKDAGSCEVIANPVTEVLLCSLWTPAEGEGAALEAFRKSYLPRGNR